MFELEIVETDQFRLDCALYEVEAERLSLLHERLAFNPVAGTRQGSSLGLWNIRLGPFRATYALSNDISRIVLLRIVPYEAPASRALPKLLALVRAINDLKRLFGL